MEGDHKSLEFIAGLGEGQHIEYKQSPAKLDREIVGFANANGGYIYCGITDSGEIVGTDVSNSIKSQIQDIARNCDPPISVRIRAFPEKVLQIEIPEGHEKPYQCSSGFFLRVGANCQKLRATEIRSLLSQGQSFFDSQGNRRATVQRCVSKKAFEHYCNICHIQSIETVDTLLENLGAATVSRKGSESSLTNAGVLLFTKTPREYIPESYLTTVRYQGTDKFDVLDRQDFTGDILQQIEGGLTFVRRHVDVQYEISDIGRRVERFTYPLVAIREALINALIHRDYSFQNSCVYLSIYSDRLEIENPGGVFGGASVTTIEGKSMRRNPLLADLLYRAGYGEKLGSGLARIREALEENSNPKYQLSSTNFFMIRFLPRLRTKAREALSKRQIAIAQELAGAGGEMSSQELAEKLHTSSTTIVRELRALINFGLVIPIGTGRATRYRRAT